MRQPLLVQGFGLLSLLFDLAVDLSHVVEDISDIVSGIDHWRVMSRLAWALGNDRGVIKLLFELLFLGGSRLGWSSSGIINDCGSTSFLGVSFLRSWFRDLWFVLFLIGVVRGVGIL